MSETFLRQIILEELEYDPSLDATNIGVAVEKGIVTLTGHVTSFAEKQVAISRLARRRQRPNFVISFILSSSVA